jgi:hypothetical protein
MPNRINRRWHGWTLPSKLSVVGGLLAIPALIFGVMAWIWPDFWKRSAPPQAAVQQITTGEGSAGVVGDHNTVTTGTKPKDQAK